MIATRNITLVLLILFFLSCKTNSNKERLTEQSLEVSERFFEALKVGDRESVLNLISGELYAKYSRDNVSFILNDIEAKYGTLKEHTLLETRFSTSVKAGKEEQVIVNTYKTFYSSGFMAEEQLSFTLEKGTDKLEKIDGYLFDNFSPE